MAEVGSTDSKWTIHDKITTSSTLKFPQSLNVEIISALEIIRGSPRN